MAGGIKKRKGKAPLSPWSDQMKVQVVTQYLALGKAPLVEALTGVPRQTIRLWKTQPWWGELVREIQQESDQETDAKLQKIIDKSLDVINDRLDNGELIFNSKTGKAERLPVRLRDAGQISRDMFQQQERIRKKPELLEKEEANADRLLKLAETFAQFAQALKPRREEKEIEGEEITFPNEGEVIEDADSGEIQEGQGEVRLLDSSVEKEKFGEVESISETEILKNTGIFNTKSEQDTGRENRVSQT